MKKKSTAKTIRYAAARVPATPDAELERLSAMPEERVDVSDIAPQNIRELRRGNLTTVLLQLDRRTLAWFRRQGPDYQARIRAALRDHARGPRQGQPGVRKVM